MTASLNQWMVVQDAANVPGQAKAIRLIGLVSGQPGVSDGSCVRTTQISSADGRRVTTKTGSHYILRDPHPDALAVMKNFDACSPLQGLV